MRKPRDLKFNHGYGIARARVEGKKVIRVGDHFLSEDKAEALAKWLIRARKWQKGNKR